MQIYEAFYRNPPKGARLLTDYRNIHKGKEIFIVGTGPSLDKYPVDFLKNKISIGLNFAFTALETTYIHFIEGGVAGWILNKGYPELFEKSIIPPHFVAWNQYVNLNVEGYNPIYMPYIPTNGTATLEDFRKLTKDIMEEKDYEIINQGGVATSSIFCALVLGAKTITLIGYDQCQEPDKSHADCVLGAYEDEKDGTATSKNTKKSVFQQQIQGLAWIKEVLEPYNIEVRKHKI